MTSRSARRFAVLCAIAVVAIAVPRSAFAQVPPGSTRTIGVYANAHFGVAIPSESTHINFGEVTFGSSSESGRGEYPINSGFAFEFGGGVVLKQRWIAGVAFSRAASSDPGEFTLMLNHPPAHGPIEDTVATDPFNRTENAFHIQGGVLIPMGRLELMFFGGPSRFSVSQQVVDELDADEIFNGQWTVSIIDTESALQTASAWGFNVGGDVSFSIGRGCSIGGQVRYSGATVSVEDPIASLTTGSTVMKDMKVGGVQVLGGIRFRF